MRSFSRLSLALIAASCLPALHAQTGDKPSFSQTPSEAPQATTATLSVQANLVNVPVIVRDKKGALIQNLVKDDFVLNVDGKPQTIRYFDQDRDIPLILGLMVDTSMSQREVLDSERTASATFLEQMLTGKQDKAFVIQFARQADLLQDLTTSKPKLQAALKQIDSSNSSPSFSNGGGNNGNDPNDPNDNNSNNGNQNGGRGGRNGGSRGGGAGTVLYDALFLASDEITAKQKGRKAIIILSDGVDHGSKESLTKAMEAAQRADTIVYAIYFKGKDQGGGNNRGFGFPGGGGRGGGFPGGGGRGGGGYPGGGGGGNRGGGDREVDGKKILERMAQETGGRFFEITKKQPVEDIYTQIGQELRAQYRLGFTPDKDTASDGYHEIALTLKDSEKKKLTVQTRDGYYTGSKE